MKCIQINQTLQVKKLKVNDFYNLDCIKGLKQLDDHSVDLILASPPYDTLRDYNGNNDAIDFRELGKQVSRVLKYRGMCILVLNDRTKLFKSMTSMRLILDWHDNTTLRVWEIPIYARDGNPGAYWTKRFRVDHEYVPIFININPADKETFTPNYFNKKHMLVPTKHNGTVWGGIRKTSNGKILQRNNIIVRDKKCCGTIFRYSSSNSEQNKLKNQHPAPFPDKLAEDLIKAFTKKNMLVVDMFSGSGTTGIMAYKNKRKFIGFDICDDYIQLSKKRFKNET